MNDGRIARERQITASAALDRAPDYAPYSSAAKVVVTVTVMTYPTTANVFYGCQEQQLTGSVAEGAAPTIASVGPTIYAYNVGTQIPPVETLLVIHSVGGRWVFRYDG